MVKYKEYIKEGVIFYDGDRVVVKNGKYKNKTGIITSIDPFMDSEDELFNEEGFRNAEITLDYTGDKVKVMLWDLTKSGYRQVTAEDPYGEEVWDGGGNYQLPKRISVVRSFESEEWEISGYNEYLKENELRLDGKHGFFMFLKLIDDMKMHFIKTNHFLNVGKYQYFFTTEHIKRKDQFLGYFRDSLSLKVTCDTVKRFKDERLSFYFGVKNNILEYGFHDDMKREIYKTGQFDTNTKYLRSLKSYKCLVLIENILKNSNIAYLNLLQEIKSHLKGWYEGKGSILILNELMVRKAIKRDDIHDDAKESVALLQKYEKWCDKFKWANKVYYYIDNEEDNEVHFYIKIKTKKEEKDEYIEKL